MKRFVVLALLAFLISFALVRGIAFRMRARASTDAEHALAGRAQLVAHSIDRIFQARLGATFTFSTLPSLRGLAASDPIARPARAAVALTELHAVVASDPNVRAVSVLDEQGIVILTTDRTMGMDWSARAFTRASARGHPHISVPARDFGEVSQFYSAPILDNSANVAGTLVVRVAAQEFWDALRAAEDVLVIDEDGVRVADTTPAPRVFSAIAPLSNDAVARVVRESRYGAETTQLRVDPMSAPTPLIQLPRASQTVLRDASGNPYLAAIYPLVSVPWRVIAMEPEPQSFERVNRVWWEAFAWGGASALLAAAFAYFGSRRELPKT